MHWETKKSHLTHFIIVFALFQCPGTEPAISLRCACAHPYVIDLQMLCPLHLFALLKYLGV